MTRVKICGLTDEADLEAAIDAGADAVGIICDVSVDTPREVSIERATALAAATPPFVTSVLVTMPDGPADAIELVEEIEPDAIQIHSDIRPGDLAYLRANLEAELLLAVDADDAATAETYDEIVDGLLVDTGSAEGGGGTGRTHDWDRTRTATADLESPLILAGGLTPENVGDAVRTVAPFAVDVASGVEERGGVKDHEAVRSFVDRAKTARKRAEPDA
ncbi:phosphoribosylanthranilate isomerase [Natrinema pellirubrum DSM 15624]|uniref:N-(5'-phosphoribosyl)anthranilate isomerase n=1 Tax=Natrinema pellirubrum (strain DSM 15624 / CIP 106293 / JCM 10476 / NCIMB 786 / 157) TaxID=797303 RepID=L0JKF0_NATP1|nr:phosphoribosylanthranilate isomerase [Natrinema pellirubrum]AGB31062.1 phosphoribosylanthranilate isomerase [Natrinema pellirubrum DSM 15624]ELY81098.1 phosphoribosylanthranilate isomerase [Natrinema pellirubrum DSM 15624]